MNSKVALALCMFLLLLTGFVYYPKWNKERTEATLSWDVSGYYMYLPAIFIYQDIKKLEFKDALREKYNFTPDFQQAFYHEESGNFVMKYPVGQALQYLPFFAAGHAAAHLFGYEPDGFSTPYQVAISIGAFLVAFLGLFYLRRILLTYFSETVTGLTLLVIVFATNYLNYAAIDGPMTHNLLFTLYALLLYVSDRFYKKPTTGKALLIGFICGWATLTRPTEIISLVIPLLWGVYSMETLRRRLQFIGRNLPKYALAAVVFVLTGSLQMLYWKYVTGDFLVYSYQEQTFSWLKPHLRKGIFSYQSGWLIYTPAMVFSLIGFWFLRKSHQNIFPAILTFSLVFIYICFAWDIWWYGGSLGIRAMVQSYPALAFPLAALLAYVSHNMFKYVVGLLLLLFTVYNMYWTHQAHLGGLLVAGGMTKPYFWKVLGKSKEDLPDEIYKLLDTDEEFTGVRKDVKQIFAYNFEADSAFTCSVAINGAKSFCLNKDRQYSPEFSAPIALNDAEYVRAKATFLAPDKEWDTWRMCQFIVKFSNNDEVVKQKYIRVQRFFDSGQKKEIFIDVKLPEKSFNKVSVVFWNSESQKEIILDDLTIEQFNG